MGRKTVLIVGKLPPPYIGPAVATNIILNSTLKEEFELLHLNTKVNNSIDDFGKGGIGKLFKNLSIYTKLFKLLKSSKADLVLIPISQTTIGFLKDSIFILIASLFSTKILLQLRGSNFKNWMNSATFATEKYVRFCFNKTKGMIVLGDNLRYLFEDYYLPDQIYVVPNGCDISIPESTEQSAKVQLLYFANFLPSKGIKEVLEALVLLKKRGILGFELNAVGAWDNETYKATCFNIVEENSIPVTFHKPKSGEQKWQAFADADIFLFTPNSPEGHPWVIVEAMAAGLPIISTNQGAIKESVVEGFNGFIVAENNPNELADQLKILLVDKELRASFAKNSKEHYLQNFTEHAMVQNLKKTFIKVLE